MFVANTIARLEIHSWGCSIGLEPEFKPASLSGVRNWKRGFMKQSICLYIDAQAVR